MEKLIYFRGASGDAEGGGLTLEETWFTNTIISNERTICVISNRQPPQPNTRITWKILMDPQNLLGLVRRAYTVELNTRDVDGQRQRWGDLCPAYITLVFDGYTGHCINLVGIERRTKSFIYWDPWPGRSLLCKEENVAGVAAQPCRGSERFWLITSNDLERVVYAVLLPFAQWRDLINNPVPPNQ